MNINLLEKIKKDGYLILKRENLNFDFDFEELDKVFDFYIKNEETLFLNVRFHNEGTLEIKNSSEIEKIIKDSENKEYWFQIWKTAPLFDESKDLIKKYNSKIVELIYGVSPSGIHSEFSSFTQGCAIKLHRDASDNNPNRLCAVLNYINDGWKQEYGGCLVLENGEIITPENGTIVILDFTENNLLHEVTPVTVNKSRLSLTSFIDYENKL